MMSKFLKLRKLLQLDKNLRSFLKVKDKQTDGGNQ